MSEHMTDEEFDAFFEIVTDELKQKQNELQVKHGIGEFDRWWYEQATSKLQFYNADDHQILEADTIDIGSYSPKSITWKWAWSNESVLPSLRKQSEVFKELESITGYDIFGTEYAFEIEDQNMAWGLAAFAVNHINALGCYCAPSSKEDGPTTYLAITKIYKVGGYVL